MSDPAISGALPIDKAMLRGMPLPAHAGEVDKDARGRVLAIGGCTEMPGALLLAGVAALRAGAGKLQLAIGASVAPLLALAIPEALVMGLDEADGAISPVIGERLLSRIAHCDAVLLGPGLAEGGGARDLTEAIVRANPDMLVLDALALANLESVRPMLLARDGRTVLTPHGGEMATLLGTDKASVLAAPATHALEAAARFGAVVALKGADTHVAAPDGGLFRYTGGDVGLATAGSGDTLAGILAGFLARGMSPLAATLWAVHVHGEAGRRLAHRIGRVGFLARELLGEVPLAMAQLEGG